MGLGLQKNGGTKGEKEDRNKGNREMEIHT